MTIYLYVKTHNVTGLKYLGKTQKDPYKYNGAGKYWVRHIEKYGYDIKTEILLATESEIELKETGLFFSKIFNVVKSKEWANLTEESGNGISYNFSSELQKKRIREGNLPQLYTKEKAIAHNKKMLELGIHPSQRFELIKRTNEKMLKNGTHPFTNPIHRETNSKAVKEYQLQLSKSGNHNFKNKIPVIDKNGKQSIISTEEYAKQKINDDMSSWEYVSVASLEAKARRLKTQ
jgi:hypothetical protein